MNYLIVVYEPAVPSDSDLGCAVVGVVAAEFDREFGAGVGWENLGSKIESDVGTQLGLTMVGEFDIKH